MGYFFLASWKPDILRNLDSPTDFQQTALPLVLDRPLPFVTKLRIVFTRTTRVHVIYLLFVTVDFSVLYIYEFLLWRK